MNEIAIDIDPIAGLQVVDVDEELATLGAQHRPSLKADIEQATRPWGLSAGLHILQFIWGEDPVLVDVRDATGVEAQAVKELRHPLRR